ncbi:PCMD domain-containing protein [Mangrovivirga sp. M17]|uniref:PCMD domain-containing protein n=1 Tax=Mangrovivirga halotolerans TaxID=2993936 RepID=A0ABT3RQQ7_9BACT|nr:PCMD domain-containing protein [Mangrovivirga halotolerans]MCX2743826.1 PCMD domain-containing protein [Mangrovivirga halotolerans]
MKNFYFIFFSLIVFSCVDEDFFGLSDQGNIKNLVVRNQAKNAVINRNDKTVEVEIPGGVDLTEIEIQTIEISSFARANKKAGDVLNLTDSDQIIITAEDGTISTWTITAFVASSTPQLDNGDLNSWYQTASEYYEPGESAANTIWGTGNKGTQILNKLATVPEDLGNDNLAAKMITLDNGLLGSTFGAPIAAGSIFTGVFNSDKIDPSDPEAAIEFGTPFIGRPIKLKFKYQYEPGSENKDRNGNLLPYSDMLDIYALLEVRANGKTERLATAWFRSGDPLENLVEKEVLFTYGELDNSFPDYMKPTDHGYVSMDSVEFVLPTHITFVASSSFGGAEFAGAIGSTLIIDDIEMVYE